MDKKMTILNQDGDQFDTIQYMEEISKRYAKDPWFQRWIQKHQLTPGDLDLLYAVLWNFIEFERDPEGFQTIRTPQRSLNERKANCVDYSVLVSAFLQNLGVPHVIRMVSFQEMDPGAYSHVYPVLMDGRAFDLCVGKEFNSENPGLGVQIPFINQYDLKI